MEKLKGVAKHGVHPTGDHEIHRKTWKSDVKDIALRRNPDKANLDAARNHTSAPLSSLKDPDSFGPPPKHSGASAVVPPPVSSSSSSSSAASAARQPKPRPGGWGAPVPAPRRKQEEQEAEEEEEAPPLPYRTDTTGLRTDNLPKPPARTVDSSNDTAAAPAPPPRFQSPAGPPLPTRPQQQQPPPVAPSEAPVPSLPPRMNENPTEYTPPAPPSYQEAARVAQHAGPLLNQGSINRLGKAGVSISGLGIGNGTTNPNSTTSPSSANFQNHVRVAQQAAPLLNQNSLNRLGTAGASISGLGVGSGRTSTNNPDSTTSRSSADLQSHVRVAQQAAPLLNQGSINRLGQAGVSVPGFGIGSKSSNSNSNADSNASADQSQTPPPSQGHAGQLSELQQRFARMGAGGTSSSDGGGESASSPASASATSSLVSAAAAVAAHKKPPPPPPPKKPGLTSASGSRPGTADDPNAPPAPSWATKPRFA